jgi:hypothetical protein
MMLGIHTGRNDFSQCFFNSKPPKFVDELPNGCLMLAIYLQDNNQLFNVTLVRIYISDGIF